MSALSKTCGVVRCGVVWCGLVWCALLMSFKALGVCMAGFGKMCITYNVHPEHNGRHAHGTWYGARVGLE